MKKRTLMIVCAVLCLSMLLLLPACRRADGDGSDLSDASASSGEDEDSEKDHSADDEPDSSEQEPGSPASSVQTEEGLPGTEDGAPEITGDSGTETTSEQEPVRLTARQAYKKALLALLCDGVMPDGQTVTYDSAAPDLTGNRFSVWDVDGDGLEELVLLYTSDVEASCRSLVMGWNQEEQKLVTQLEEYPALTFFQNGIVMAEWSHNQGRGGDFWPYSLYEYRPDSDSYSYAGSVDAWDSTVYPEDYPAAADVSGTGRVYYVSNGGPFSWDEPMDADQYYGWLDQFLGETEELQIDYYKLTEENIQQITEEPEWERAE